MKKLFRGVLALCTLLLTTLPMFASEANLVVPNIKEHPLSYNLLLIGIVVAVIGSIFALSLRIALIYSIARILFGVEISQLTLNLSKVPKKDQQCKTILKNCNILSAKTNSK